MAARASMGGDDADSVQVRSQFLRDNPPVEANGPISGFSIVPEGEPLNSAPGASRRHPPSIEGDVKRAVDAANEAGLSAYRVEIDPDGTISLVVGMPENGEALPGAAGTSANS